VVSNGPSLVIVPDVTCSTYKQAKARIEGLHLTIQLGDPVLPLVQCPNPVNVAQQDTEPNSAVPPGTVIVVHQGMLKPSPTPSPSP
jgi:beta-lactam-binding protein with PASTA domain